MGGLGLSLRDDFIAFSMACPDVKYTNSLKFRIGEMLTLKVFLMDSIPAIP